MKTILFSDVHGNLPALEKMLEATQDADNYICLGDIVNYGPWSNECVELTHSIKNCIVLQGNHELYFLENKYEGSNEVALAFFSHCIKTFHSHHLIKNLPISYLFHDFICIHTLFNKNIYPDTPLVLDNNYIIGHSHHQFYREISPFKVYNTGSVGQNRKYINIINYIEVIESNQNLCFNLCMMPYDINKVINEMISRNYPTICLNYYRDKQILK